MSGSKFPHAADCAALAEAVASLIVDPSRCNCPLAALAKMEERYDKLLDACATAGRKRDETIAKQEAEIERLQNAARDYEELLRQFDKACSGDPAPARDY